MKQIKVFLLIVLTLTMAFVSSCKKDHVAPASTGCHISKMDISFWGMDITSVITYNSANQVIDMQNNNDGEITGTLFSYTADGRVSKTEEYEDVSKVVTGKTEYSYGANGVTEEKVYVDRGGPLELYAIYRYEYANNKRSRKNIYSVNAGQEIHTDYLDYNYAANGDVSMTLTFTEDGAGGWEPSYRRTYTYNDKIASGFTKVLILISEDINFPSTHYMTLELQEDYDPITQSWEVGNILDFVYSFDTKDNPTKIDIGKGSLVFNLSWDCN